MQASHEDVVFMLQIKTQSLSDETIKRRRASHHQLYGWTSGRGQEHTHRQSDLGLAYLSSPPALASQIPHRATLPVSFTHTLTHTHRSAILGCAKPKHAVLTGKNKTKTQRQT